MPEVTGRQTRILFELSNGKRLIVSDRNFEAFICSERELAEPNMRIAARFDDVRRLADTGCLSEPETTRLVGLGDVTSYGISRGGLQTLFETSLRHMDD